MSKSEVVQNGHGTSKSTSPSRPQVTPFHAQTDGRVRMRRHTCAKQDGVAALFCPFVGQFADLANKGGQNLALVLFLAGRQVAAEAHPV